MWLRGALPTPPHLPLAPLVYSLVGPHAAVGPGGVPGVEDLPGVSIHPRWTQTHRITRGASGTSWGAALGIVSPWSLPCRRPLRAAGNSPTTPSAA